MLKWLCLAIRLCDTISGPAYTIDGDTIAVDGYHVRLAGLDAEEMSEPNGPAAKMAMIRLLYRQTVVCTINGKSYNRYVGTCHIGSLDLAAEMIRQGWALDCARYSGGKYRHLEPIGSRRRLAQKPYC